MRLNAYLIMIVGLSGCGSSITALDSLPKGPDVSSAEWPRLIDTPALPAEELLNTQTGERVIERLDRQGNEIEARRLRADSVLPVSEQLTARAIASRSRSDAAANPAVDEASLLARAAQSRESTRVTSAQFDERDLLARAARQRERNTDTAHFVDEDDLLARVARQQARDADGTRFVNESDLLARAARQQQRTAGVTLPSDGVDLRARSQLNQTKSSNVASISSPPKATDGPSAPRPLRPLESPVVSSSFEERARLALKRAADAGT